jgi:hypothetical protein
MKQELRLTSSTENLPPVVYHYTSMDTLLKIVDTGTIWATNIQYLNDASERDHCLAVIRKRLDSDEGHELFGPVIESESEREERGFMPFLPFIASFSKDRDALTQWRSYCPQGNGVCIGFRTESLKNATVELSRTYKGERDPEITVSFDAVRYLDSTDLPFIDRVIKDALEEATEFVNTAGGRSTRDDDFWWNIEGLACRVKHNSFFVEQEYRLMATLISGGAYYTRYRASRSTLVPYVALALPDPSQFLSGHDLDPFYPERPFFIDNVTIGPTPHPELSAKAVERLFRDIHRDVSIRTSFVPYRDW